MPKVSGTVLEINLKYLEQNYKYLRSRLKSTTKFIAVVKAFAYGSDSIQVAKKMETLKVDYLAVAYVTEGVKLREAGIKTPILVLHPQAVHFKNLIDSCLEPCLYSKKSITEFLKICEKQKQAEYPIHLKCNTGLNRLGFCFEDISYISKKLQKTNVVKVRSVFSHLAASEDLSEKQFSQSQINTFLKISEKVTHILGFQPLLHICNTSGIFNFPDAHLDMVRSGIGLYGFGNSKKENKNLKPIATLKTTISQIHTIKKGETVGYNRAYVCTNEFEKIATLPIGHADGISRTYGKDMGWVTIQGEKAPIIGNVCMDMIMVNITNINCKEGDEVIIFGQDVTAEKLSNAVDSISYELLTAISQRVKRVYLE